MNDEDPQLRRVFEKLRADDARHAPSFDAIRKKRSPRRSVVVTLLPLASAFAAAAVFLVWCNRPEPTQQRMASRAVSVAATAQPTPQPRVDDAPLDFLLKIPGLHGAPDFDSSLLRGSLR